MVTTTTTTTVVTVTTATGAIAYGILGLVVLIGFLIVRELTSGYFSENDIGKYRYQRIKAFGRNTIVAILPLLLVFILIVALEVSSYLT